MSSELNNNKICSSCGHLNLSDNKFCTGCGKVLGSSEEKKFEVIETLKGSLIGSIICISIFIAFMILVSVVVVIQRTDVWYVLFIIWPIVIGFLIWAACYLEGLSKKRRFTITKNYIEILVPNKPYFKINWSDFDTLQIAKRINQTWIVTSPGPRFVYFKLIFKGSNFEKSFEFESGKDFKSRTRKKIISALGEYTDEMNKKFIGWKKK